MHKTLLFSYNFSFFIRFIPLVDTIEIIKPAPGDHEYNFKKVGAIPSEPGKTYYPHILQQVINIFDSDLVWGMHLIIIEG